jgi:hypothetical protein
MPNAAVNTSTYGRAATPPRKRFSDFPNFASAYDAHSERKWQIEVQQRLVQYAKYPTDWDSYGAPAIGWEAGMFALSVLNDFMRPRTPIPQVVPSSSGGVQLEWHEKGIDLELHIAGPYRCELWFRDLQSPGSAPISLDLTDDFSPLRAPIEMLTNR